MKSLARGNLLGEVEIVAAESPIYVQRYSAWSVPLLLLNDTPVAADPLSPGDVEALIRQRDITLKDPVEAFKETIIHSGYLSSIVALWAQ